MNNDYDFTGFYLKHKNGSAYSDDEIIKLFGNVNDTKYINIDCEAHHTRNRLCVYNLIIKKPCFIHYHITGIKYSTINLYYKNCQITTYAGFRMLDVFKSKGLATTDFKNFYEGCVFHD